MADDDARTAERVQDVLTEVRACIEQEDIENTVRVPVADLHVLYNEIGRLTDQVSELVGLIARRDLRAQALVEPPPEQ